MRSSRLGPIIMLCFALEMQAQTDRPPDLPEHVVETRDGRIVLRDVYWWNQQFNFQANVVNDLKHGWSGPRLKLKVKGIDRSGKEFQETFEALMFCDWLPGKSCSVVGDSGLYKLKSLSSLEIEIVGGRQIPTEEERKAAEVEAEQRRIKAAQAAADSRASVEASRASLEKSLKDLAIRCGALYRKTAGKKLSDLTVAEADQIGTCKELGLYRSR